MEYRRFFTFKPIIGNKAYLTDGEYYHATKVLRLKQGHKIIINDNSNKDYYCSISKVEKDCIIAEIDDIIINQTYDDTNIELFVGLCKEFDSIIPKAVELGARSITPFTSQHTNINGLNTQRAERIILSSTKQCCRPNLMTLNDTITFNQALKQVASYEKTLLFYEQERQHKLSAIPLDKTAKIALFIGSEGGFSKDEIAEVKAQNIEVLTLGKRILRVETAVVVALTLCLQKLGKL